MNNLRLLCILFLIYSILVFVFNSEFTNLLDKDKNKYKKYIIIKHIIISIVSIIIFGISFTNAKQIFNNNVINTVFMDIIIIDLLFHMYVYAKKFKAAVIDNSEKYHMVSIIMLIPILFAFNDNRGLICIGLSTIYLIVSLFLFTFSEMKNKFGILIRLFGSVIMLGIFIFSIFIPDFGLYGNILTAYRIIQGLHIVISSWTLLNIRCTDEPAVGLDRYHGFNLLYGIIKLIASFV